MDLCIGALAPVNVFGGIALILTPVRDSINDGKKVEISAHECGIESLGTHELSLAPGATVILPWPH